MQETLEGFVASGHPQGLAGVFGHGGWWAVPLAAIAALALALALRVADSLVRRAEEPPSRRSIAPLFVPLAAAPLRARPLATAAAGRAPPRLR